MTVTFWLALIAGAVIAQKFGALAVGNKVSLLASGCIQVSRVVGAVTAPSPFSE